MGRAPCCEKVGLNKGRWTAEEDDLLKNYILAHGEGSWRSLPKNAGLLRCGKSCRLRWINYLRSDVKRGNITPQEQDLIVKLHSTFGNKWSLIASQLEGRTDNEIKNYWNSHLSRKIHYFRKQWRTSDPGNTTTTTMTTTAELQPQPPRRQGRGRTSRANMKKNKHLRSHGAIITEEEGNNIMNINNGANIDHDRVVVGPGGEGAAVVEDHRHLMCFDDDTMMDPRGVLTTLPSTKENSTSVEQPEISCSNAGESSNYVDHEQAWMSACDSINTSNGGETQQDQLLSWLMWDTDGGCGFQEAQCEPKDQEDAMLAWLLS